MKQYLNFLLLVLILLGCDRKDKTLQQKNILLSKTKIEPVKQIEITDSHFQKQNEKKENLHKNKKEHLLSLFECNKVKYQIFSTDSISILENNYGRYQILGDSIKKLHPKLNYKQYINEKEKAIYKKDNIEVHRTKDTVKIRLDNGELKTIYAYNPKASYDEGRSIADYFPKENLVLIAAHIDEAGHYYLMDKKTGKQHMLIGKPIFSPNRKFILSINGDIEYGSTINGIQLFQFNKELKEICFFQLASIEPRKVKWIDNNTFVLELLKNSWTQNDQSYIYNKIKFEIEQ